MRTLISGLVVVVAVWRWRPMPLRRIRNRARVLQSMSVADLEKAGRPLPGAEGLPAGDHLLQRGFAQRQQEREAVQQARIGRIVERQYAGAKIRLHQSHQVQQELSGSVERPGRSLLHRQELHRRSKVLHQGDCARSGARQFSREPWNHPLYSEPDGSAPCRSTRAPCNWIRKPYCAARIPGCQRRLPTATSRPSTSSCWPGFMRSSAMSITAWCAWRKPRKTATPT